MLFKTFGFPFMDFFDNTKFLGAKFTYSGYLGFTFRDFLPSFSSDLNPLGLEHVEKSALNPKFTIFFYLLF